MYVCSGGEDTVLRIQEVEGDETRLLPATVVRGHVSSIKCLAVVHREGEALLVSGGGRAQLLVWRLSSVGGDIACTSIADYMLRGSDKDVRKPWRKAQSLVRHDPETRSGMY